MKKKLLKTHKILDPKDTCAPVNEKTFYKKDYNLLILTENGKPVFTTFGNEYSFTPTFATISIILNKCEISWSSQKKDLPLFFKNHKKTIVFYKKNHFWFILINTQNFLPLSFLYKILKLVNKKLIMAISGAMVRTLGEKPSFDVLSHFDIDKKSFVHFQYSLLKCIPPFFDCCNIFPMSSDHRELVKKLCDGVKQDFVSYLVFFCNFQVVFKKSDYDYELDANELNCLLIDVNYRLEDNLQVYDKEICFFSLEENAMFRVFAKYFDEFSGCVLITTFQGDQESVEKEVLTIFRDLEKGFRENDLFRILRNFRNKLPLELDERYSNVEKAIVLNRKLNQISFFGFEGFLVFSNEEKDFFKFFELYEIWNNMDDKKIKSYENYEYLNDYSVFHSVVDDIHYFVKEKKFENQKNRIKNLENTIKGLKEYNDFIFIK